METENLSIKIQNFWYYHKWKVLAGAFLGNYVQKNKTNVKEKLKEFIDKF